MGVKKENAQTARGQLRFKTGVVSSSQMNKTVVVTVTRQVRHRKYGKIVKKTDKLYAHDETNVCKIGDAVEVVESRPLSRLKRWRVHKVLSHAVV